MFVRAQVVNPELRCPGFLGGGFAVEEEDVGLDAGRRPEFAGSEERDGKAEG